MLRRTGVPATEKAAPASLLLTIAIVLAQICHPGFRPGAMAKRAIALAKMPASVVPVGGRMAATDFAMLGSLLGPGAAKAALAQIAIKNWPKENLRFYEAKDMNDFNKVSDSDWRCWPEDRVPMPSL